MVNFNSHFSVWVIFKTALNGKLCKALCSYTIFYNKISQIYIECFLCDMVIFTHSRNYSRMRVAPSITSEVYSYPWSLVIEKFMYFMIMNGQLRDYHNPYLPYLLSGRKSGEVLVTYSSYQ